MTDPSDARINLAGELRLRRRLAGLSGRQLARSIDTSQAFISRVENGVAAIPDRKLRAWLAATGAGADTVNRLLLLNRRAHLSDASARPEASDIEQRSSSMQVFDPAGIPALLWTPMYAWQTLGSLYGEASDETARLVDELRRRQEPLISGKKHYEFLLTSHALPAPTNPVNRGLLGNILSLEGKAKIAIIDNDACPITGLIKSAFAIYADFEEDDMDPLVCLTLLHTEITVTNSREVEHYIDAYKDLAGHATEIDWAQLMP